MGNPEEGVRREYAALGLRFLDNAASIFEEGLAVLRQLWTEGKVTFHGKHFNYDDVTFLLRHGNGAVAPRAIAASHVGSQQPAPGGRHEG